MGRAKALLPWAGRTMIEHVVGVLRSVVEEVVVVSQSGLVLPPLPAQVVEDREPGLGPLAGIREGLEVCSAEYAFVTSTDAPFLDAGFVERMFSFGSAAAPEVDGFVQSMAAVYPGKSAPVAARLLTAGRRRPLFLLEDADFRRVTPEELGDLKSLESFNTPEEYLDAIGLVARGSGEPPAPVEVELLGVARARAGVATVSLACGTLSELLQSLEEQFPSLGLLEEGQLSPHFLVSLGGRTFLRDPHVPIGPGERISLMDAAVGG